MTDVLNLERAVEANEIVRALKRYGVSQAEVGTVAGVADRAVRNWASAGIRPQRYDKLSELRDLVLLLSDALTPRGTGQWLHARNRLLGGARPLELLASGRGEEVRRAAQAFVDGSYVRGPPTAAGPSVERPGLGPAHDEAGEQFFASAQAESPFLAPSTGTRPACCRSVTVTPATASRWRKRLASKGVLRLKRREHG